jgi:methyl-accepting chemotaxis protein
MEWNTAMLKLKLSHKIAAIGLIGILGAILLGVVYMRGAASQTYYLERADAARTVATLGSKTVIEMLQSRRAEKDFLLRSDAKYVQRHAEMTKRILADVAELEGLVAKSTDAGLIENLAIVRKGFESYAAYFSAMAEARTRLGLDEKSGLEGALRASVHAAEEKVKELDDLKLTNLLLMMRRHEKDFMLRRAAKYGDEIRKRVSEFEVALAASSAPESAKQDLSQRINDYQKNFFDWMGAAEAMAKEQKAASEAFSAIEPAIDAVEKSVESLRVAAEAAYAETSGQTQFFMQATIVAVVLFAGLLSFLIGRSISRPLQAMTDAMAKLASGDLAVNVSGADRSDEIGDMARAMEVFKDNMTETERLRAAQKATELRTASDRKVEMHRLADEFQNSVGGIVDTVSAASSQLESAASSLTRTAETTQELSGVVAAASEQTSSNVQGVAAASEQLSATVSEISRQVQESSSIAAEAVVQASRTNDRVSALSRSADRIGDVIGLINTIAGQTNLLALNATIEAARAGDAGKGFAVVAQEVKALADQTAKATSEIASHIASMQQATQEAVGAIGDITTTINKMSEISGAIAAAVEEQGATTKEISRNVLEAAKGTSEVASSISDVSKGASDTGTASSQVLSSAVQLSKDSGVLRREVERFLSNVRAA